jgi:hypothetical protein
MPKLTPIMTVVNTVPSHFTSIHTKTKNKFVTVKSIQDIKSQFGGKLVALKSEGLSSNTFYTSISNDESVIFYGIINNNIGFEPRNGVNLTYIPLEALLKNDAVCKTTSIASFEDKNTTKLMIYGNGILKKPLQMREVTEEDKTIIKEALGENLDEKKLGYFPFTSNETLEQYFSNNKNNLVIQNQYYLD